MEPEKKSIPGAVQIVKPKAKKGGHLTVNVHVGKILQQGGPGRYRPPSEESDKADSR